MQSGISASEELLDAFRSFASDPSQRGLLATISKEQLVSNGTITSEFNDFANDLPSLGPYLKDNEAAYVILRRFPEASDGFVAVTYVPDAAPVRQKMLFASTRLSLVRELGIERFRETIFATTREELTADGFKKHDQHAQLAAPLTEEEQSLGAVKKAEGEEGLGMSVRKGHISDSLSARISERAVDALQKLKSSEGGANLVQLKIDIPTETIDLASLSTASASSIGTMISATEPRYSFFRHSYISENGSSLSPIIFVYTCPTASKIKERMIYAATRRCAVRVAETEAGLVIEKTLEMSDPEELTENCIEEEFKPKVEIKKAFERPKRPGRR